MDLIRWGDGLADPFLEFENLQDEINRLFDDARVSEPRGLFERTYSPAVDVVEKDDSFDVFCDVPGIAIKDIEIPSRPMSLRSRGRGKGTPRAATGMSTGPTQGSGGSRGLSNCPFP